MQVGCGCLKIRKCLLYILGGVRIIQNEVNLYFRSYSFEDKVYSPDFQSNSIFNVYSPRRFWVITQDSALEFGHVRFGHLFSVILTSLIFLFIVGNPLILAHFTPHIEFLLDWSSTDEVLGKFCWAAILYHAETHGISSNLKKISFIAIVEKVSGNVKMVARDFHVAYVIVSRKSKSPRAVCVRWIVG